MSPARGGARARLEAALLDLWFSRSPGPGARLLRASLIPLSWLIAAVARRRRRRIAALPRGHPPVLVVGNLIVGGAGKTPVVIELVERLRARGWRPGIVARGYRSRAERSRAVQRVDARTDPREAGDEPVLLARRTGVPVYSARDRAAALEALASEHPEIDLVVCDDGMQHAALRRNLELAVFDARGPGNGRTLPAGPLREPLTALAACDAVLLPQGATALIQHPRVFGRRIRVEDFVHLNSGRVATPEAFATLAAQHRVVAFAGIASPERFFDALHELGIDARGIALSDHARLAPDWIAGLPGTLVLMTEKDAVKCRGIVDERCWYLRIAVDLDDALIDFVEDRLRGSQAARGSGVPDLQESPALRP